MKIDNYKSIRPQMTAADMDKQLRDASGMYEKQFLGEMVKAMRTTVSKADQPSMGEKIYSEQLDQQYVDKWGARGGLGLGDIIYNQLKERFYPDKTGMMKPIGPLPIQKGINIKVDETKQFGIPIIKADGKDTPDLSYLFEFDQNQAGQFPRDVTSPWDGEVVQVIRQEDRQLVKLSHDEGLVSTISYRGTPLALQKGDAIAAGQKLGSLSLDANGLTWQLGQA